MTARTPTRRPLLLLGLGAVTGVALAATGIVGSGQTPRAALPRGAVARVNGQVIRLDDYTRQVTALAGDRRAPLSDEQRRYVLDRLIDEELLLQRGLELGYTRLDPRVRADLTAAVIAGILAQQDTAPPAGPELEAFYAQHRDFFTGPGRFRVRQIFFRAHEPGAAPAALARATAAVGRLRAGEDFATVKAALGDAELAPLPDALLPPSKLQDYLGPTALQAVLSSNPGAVSEPVRSGTGYHVLVVLERDSGAAPPLDEIRAQVIHEFQRRAGDRALRAYLDDLRQRAAITIGADLP